MKWKTCYNILKRIQWCKLSFNTTIWICLIGTFFQCSFTELFTMDIVPFYVVENTFSKKTPITFNTSCACKSLCVLKLKIWKLLAYMLIHNFSISWCWQESRGWCWSCHRVSVRKYCCYELFFWNWCIVFLICIQQEHIFGFETYCYGKWGMFSTAIIQQDCPTVVSLWVWFYNGFNKECQQAKFSL